MALNFNVSPYYDNFDPTKEFYRILFQPGRAVQARELTQIQSMLQNQISSFGQNIFSEGSVVTGGQHQLDDSAFYLKVSPTYNNGTTTINVDFSNIVGNYIVEQSTGKIGYVKQYVDVTATDPATLFVSIIQGTQTPFSDSSTFTVYETQNSLTPLYYFTSLTGASGTCLLFHIAKGVFFTKQTFCYCPDQTVVVGKYTKIPSAIIGLNVVESIIDYADDSSLLDPALGATNYLAPGADRYKIDLQLITQPYIALATSYTNFIQLTTVVNGNISTDITTPIYSTILDTIAKRSYDTNGNFIVKNFSPTIKNDPQNTSALILDISPGSAFVQGYEIEKVGQTNLSLSKSQTTQTNTGQLIGASYGNFVYVNTLFGCLPDINAIQNTFVVQIHNVTTGQNSSTQIGTALVKNLEYSGGTGTAAIYALFLDDITLTSSFGTARSFYVPSGTYSTLGFSAIIDSSSINNALQTTLQFSSETPLVFDLPVEYVEQLANVSYFYRYYYPNISVTGTTFVINVPNSSINTFLPTSGVTTLPTYVVVDRTTGNFIPLDTVGTTVTYNTTSLGYSQATFVFPTSAYNGHTLDIIATIKVVGDSVRTKTLVQNYVPSTTLTIANTSPQDLLKSDVYSLNAVYEFVNGVYQGTWSSGYTYNQYDVVYTANGVYQSISSTSHSGDNPSSSNNWSVIQNNVGYYTFNTGQTDGYYDHGSIRRLSNPTSTINVLPIFSYFTHSSSYGYLTPQSYTSAGLYYGSIPNYVSSSGQIYALNSSIDFRPRRTDDTTAFTLQQFQLPQVLSEIDVSADVTFYLSRIDKVVLTRDGLFKVLQGVPANLNPQPPANQSDAITLFQLAYQPYTSDASSVNITVIPHKRYTMRDISSLDNRLTNIEYYTSLSALEAATNSKTITNANGTTLFKNGYIIDTFNGSGIGDVTNSEYRASIDYTNGLARPTYLVDNVYLNYQPLYSNTTTLQTTGSLVTVPFSSNVFVNQPIASTTISVNPFGVVDFVGTLKLSPESDVWFDTSSAPIVIQNPNGTNDNYVSNSGVETQWNAWQNIWSGEQINDSTIGTVGSTTGSGITTQVEQKSITTTITSSQAPGVTSTTSSYSVNNSVTPFARAATIQFKVDGMAANTQLYLWINNIHSSNYLYPYSVNSISPATASAVGSIITDSAGTARGFIRIPSSTFLTGNETIILSDNPFDWTKSISYAQATFYSKGLLETFTPSIISTKPNSTVTTHLQVSTTNNYATDVIQPANTNTNIITSAEPTFSLVSDKSIIVEGQTVNFIFTATNLPPNTKFNANLSGTITNSDIGSSSNYLLGNTTITNVGTLSNSTNVISIPINDGIISNYQNLYVQLEVDIPNSIITSSPLNLFSNVQIQSSSIPTYITSATSTIIIGTGHSSTNTANISITGNALPGNELISYSVGGTNLVASNISSGNSITGSFTLVPPGNTHNLSFSVANTYTAIGGDNLTVTFTLADGTKLTTNTAIINNVSYQLSCNPQQANTGVSSSITFTLKTTNVPNGTSVPYTISGVNPSDIGVGSLTGNSFTVSSNTASVTFTTSVLSQNKNLTLTLNTPTPLNLSNINISASCALIYIAPAQPVYSMGVSYVGIPASETFGPNGYPYVGNTVGFMISGGAPNGTVGYTAYAGGAGSGKILGNQGSIQLNSSGNTDGSVTTPYNTIAGPVTYIFTGNWSSPNSYQLTIDWNSVGGGGGTPSTPTNSGPTFTVTAPQSNVNEGQDFTVTLSSSGQSSVVSVPFTIVSNAIPGQYPSTSYDVTARTGTGTSTFNNSNTPDWYSYAVSTPGVLAYYYDCINALTGISTNITTLLATNYSNNPVFTSVTQEYNYWTNIINSPSSSPDCAAASNGLASFGQWYHNKYNTSSSPPIIGVATGTISVSDSTPGSIIFNINSIYYNSPTGTFSIVFGAPVGTTKVITVNNNVTAPITNHSTPNPVATNTGDFIDSNLTIAAALGQYTYYVDGKTSLQVLEDSTSIGKMWLNSTENAQANNYGNLVASYYRNPSVLNRNPDLGGFINFVNQIFYLQLPAQNFPAVYPVSGGSTTSDTTGFSQNYAVWVNQSTGDCNCGTTYGITRNFTVPSNGTYYVTLAGDDTVTVIIDNQIVTSFGTQNAPFQPTSASIQLTAGQHYISVFVLNAGSISNALDPWSTNPGYWAVTVSSSSTITSSSYTLGTVYFDSVSSAPSQTFVYPGTNLTEAQAIAQVATNINNYYTGKGETIGGRSQFLACTTDPLSQTFFVSENIYPNGIFLSGLDLFFATIDTNLPVFVQIRTTQNGYPSSDTVLPLSTVWLGPNQVNTSTDASVATHFTFDDLVYLPAGEYAIVVGSNSPLYTVFIGTIGQQQIGTTNIITNQPNVGSLFKSQNASTWTADQTSDMCFVLYQAIFKTNNTYLAVFKSTAPKTSFDFDLAEIITQELDFNNTTNINYAIKNQIGGQFDPTFTNVLTNQNIVLNNKRNNTNFGDTNVIAYMSTTDENVSPVIDTDRMAFTMVHNIINDKSVITIPETSPTKGGSAAKYVTRSITLSPGFDATGIKVYFDLNLQSGCSVEVYVKVQSGADNDSFSNKPWQLVPIVTPITTYSKSYTDFIPSVQYQLDSISYTYNGNIYNNFLTYAVKVVMYSTNSSIVPQIANFGAIATS